MITPRITEIEDLLRNTMGLEPASLGGDGIQRAVRLRAEQCGFNDTAHYADRVCESGEELQALIEAVVVPETWFFRHIEAFQALTEWVQTDWLSKQRGRAIRILSAPCSTGEEPYSIAIALLDAGLTPEEVCLEAIDISRRALAQAAEGVYRENSFRSAHLLFRDRYFAREDGLYRIAEQVQKMVRFRTDNLLSPGFSGGGQGYDVIFCRNVLIYFGNEKQKQVTAALSRLLAPGGLLFVGPAEGCLVMESGFAAIPQRMSFGFQRRPATPAAPALPKAKSVKTIHARPRPIQLAVMQEKAQVDTPAPDLATACQLADAGRLVEAESICSLLLQSSRASADVYALLGVIQDARGLAAEAEASYSRAIYLDPAHHQALAHLASIADRRNDFGTAKRLRERARRSEERS